MEHPAVSRVKSRIKRIRAQWIVPISTSPFLDGEIVSDGESIVDLRTIPSGRSERDDILDYGDAILMPAFVNVHTHVDYTVMRGLLEDLPFFPWVRGMVELKERLTEEDWIWSARLGIAEALSAGVGTIGDCSSTGAALQAALESKIRGIVYQEVFGIDPSLNIATALEDVENLILEQQRKCNGTNVTAGISPHSPYTCNQRMLEGVSKLREKLKIPLCIHAAESPGESQLIREGRGVIAEMFSRRRIPWTAEGVSPVAYLEKRGIIGEKTLLVHAVQMEASDVAIMSENRCSLAHCPKSNAKLCNGRAPMELVGAFTESPGIPVGIGTDSMASNNRMDMFEEMRFALLLMRAFRRDCTAHDTRKVLEMATIGGAKALGMEALTGSLEIGKKADLTVVNARSLSMTPCHDPLSALVHAASSSDVLATFVNGEALFLDGEIRGMEMERAIQKVKEIAIKLKG
jgi:cytosine/adenosine deaminase-related metal-dependent hydrolase